MVLEIHRDVSRSPPAMIPTRGRSVANIFDDHALWRPRGTVWSTPRSADRVNRDVNCISHVSIFKSGNCVGIISGSPEIGIGDSRSKSLDLEIFYH